jgi:hypothetical protein
LFLNTGGQSILLTPNLGGSVNRIESSNLPLEIITLGSSLRLAAGGASTQVTLTSTGNFLIGTTTDSGLRLDVNGAAIIRSNLTVTATNATGDFATIDGSNTIRRRTAAQVLTDIGAQGALTNPVTGTGTTNYLPKFTGASTIGNSQIFDNGTNVGINRNIPSRTLDILGGSGVGTVLKLEGASGTTTYLQLAYNGATNAQSGYIGYNSSSQLQFFTNDTLALTIDSSRNLGLGVTPSAWGSGYRALQIGPTSALFDVSSLTILSNNQYYNGGDLYLTSDFASRYVQYDGLHIWANAPSGTAGSAITFTERARITSGGNLLVGTTTDAGFKLDVNGTGRFSGNLTSGGKITSGQGAFRTGGFYVPYSTASTASRTWAMTSDEVVYGDFGIITSSTQTGDINTYRIYINPSGNVGIGTTSPSQLLHLKTELATGSGVGTAILIESGGSGGDQGWIGVNKGSGNGLEISVENRDIIFNTGATTPFGGSERMRITSGGNVGIGTSSPADKLDVLGVFRNLMPSDPTPSTGSVIFKSLIYDDSPYGVIFRGYENGTISIQSQREANNAQQYGLSLQPLGGNVLIGTTTDAGFRLDVNGTGRFSGNTTGAIATFINTNTAGTGNGLLVDVNSQLGTDNYVMNLITNGTSRMYVREDGNVGIGTTEINARLQVASSSDLIFNLTRNAVGTWGFNVTSGGNLFLNNRFGTNVFQIADLGAATFSTTSGNGITIVTNDVTTLKMNSTSGTTKNWGFATTNLAASDFGIYQSTSNGGDAISAGTPRLYFSGGGNVGIGTASPSANLHVSSGADTGIVINSSAGAYTGYLNIHSAGGGASVIRGIGGTPFLFEVNGTERMRITSGGYLKASPTGTYYYGNNVYTFHSIENNVADWTAGIVNNSASNNYGLLITYPNNAPNGGDNWFIFCSDLQNARFRVASNGNVTNTNGSYGSISDIKLKENITDATPKLDDLLKVKVRNYNLIGEETKQIGVIAQEIEEIFPGLIDSSIDKDKDGNNLGTTTKSVKYSVFVPMLIKAIQELKQEIDTLKK